MKCTGFSQDGSPRPAEDIIHNVVKKGSMLTDRVRSCNATVIATSGKLLGRNDWEIDARASVETTKKESWHRPPTCPYKSNLGDLYAESGQT